MAVLLSAQVEHRNGAKSGVDGVLGSMSCGERQRESRGHTGRHTKLSTQPRAQAGMQGAPGDMEATWKCAWGLTYTLNRVLKQTRDNLMRPVAGLRPR